MTREEAIKELELIAKVTMWNDRREAIEMAIEALQAETKHGKWVLGDGYYCSSCGYNLQTTAISCFCPNCGADMRGETE